MALPTERSRIATTVIDYIQLWYGAPGVGKTSFVDQFADNVFFISTDRGTRFLNAMRREANSWQDVEEIAMELTEPDAPHYDIVCLDHTSDIVNYAEEAVLQELGGTSLGDKNMGGWGVGWRAYKRKLFWLMNTIKSLNSGLVFVTQQAEKKVKINGVERDVIQPNLGKSAWDIIIPLADLIGYIGVTTTKNEETGLRENVRYFCTEPSTDVYAKDRINRDRGENIWCEPLDGSYFVNTFTQGASNGRNSTPEKGHTGTTTSARTQSASSRTSTASAGNGGTRKGRRARRAATA